HRPLAPRPLAHRPLVASPFAHRPFRVTLGCSPPAASSSEHPPARAKINATTTVRFAFSTLTSHLNSLDETGLLKWSIRCQRHCFRGFRRPVDIVSRTSIATARRLPRSGAPPLLPHVARGVFER